MPAPHPRALRERVIKAYNDGEGTYEELAKRFYIGEASVSRWLRRYRHTGDVAPRPAGGNRRPPIPKAVCKQVEQWVRDKPNWTTTELAQQVNKDFGLTLSRRQVGRLLHSLGFSFKRGSTDHGLPPNQKQWYKEKTILKPNI